jgi:DNA-binding NarL/FixJ family response regulator
MWMCAGRRCPKVPPTAIAKNVIAHSTRGAGMSRTRVQVFARDAISAAGVSSTLRFRPEVEVVERGDYDVAVVVALSVDEPELELVRRQRRSLDRRVVLICDEPSSTDLFAAVEAGAGALLLRSKVTEEQLIRSIRGVVGGEGSLPPDLLGRFLDEVAAQQRGSTTSRPNPMSLSGREKQVLQLLADGHSTSEIANSLAYSERTIKNAIYGLVTRWQLRNRAHAVAFAVRAGLI